MQPRDASPDEIDLSAIATTVWDAKFRIALITLLVTVLAIFWALWLPPIYRAEVLLAPASEDSPMAGSFASSFGNLGALAGVSSGVATPSVVATATLRSRTVTEAFITEQGLLPLLYADQWDSDAKSWKDPASKSVPTVWHAYRLFDQKIRTISTDKKTGLITLAIEWRDADLAAKWANELVRRTNETLQADAISECEKSIGYLTDQLGKVTAIEVRQALYRLIEAETKKAALANARREYGFKVIDPAVPPKLRSKPDRKLIVVVAFLAALGFSILWVTAFRR